jgi:hypothetical protein
VVKPGFHSLLVFRSYAAAGLAGAPDVAGASEARSMLHRAARDLTDAHHRAWSSPRLVITVRRQHRSKPYHRGQGSLAEAVA